MIAVRKAGDRGFADHGWLKTYHTFSFADYYDPSYMGFRTLRVLNEDTVLSGQGFGTHPHRDMEIITYVLEGELKHKDSMGNGSIIRPGEVQRMSAGTGVTHSEENPSKKPLHLLQIWILPDRKGLPPSYEQKAYKEEEKRGAFRLVASKTGEQGSVTIHQDAKLLIALLGKKENARYTFSPDRYGWLQVARGKAKVGKELLQQGDGAAISGEKSIQVIGEGDSELLLFDLG